MKNYTITRGREGVHCTVAGEVEAYPLAHCGVYSYAGFECGYGGIGPAHLAVCILADYLGVSPANLQKGWQYHARAADADMVIRLHHEFKVEFIAPCILGPGESYTIREADIAAWVLAADSRVPKKLAASA